MYSQIVSDTFITRNVFADYKIKKTDRIVVVGSHLDSVPAGAGINDNGSGSASTLEIAIQFAEKRVQSHNHVRFAWWAAEELGLLGSQYYVTNLSPEEKRKIALNLNFDMLGSPNYHRGIHNGTSAEPEIRVLSTEIQRVFENHFKKLSLDFTIIPFNGRSDYGPFINAKIAAGGLAAGAEGIKTQEEARRQGGEAGVAYDVCYHKKCDDYKNINQKGFLEMSSAAADASYYFAMKNDL
jgi:Zn-dependent M28 family amino/carboxypeptidase